MVKVKSKDKLQQKPISNKSISLSDDKHGKLLIQIDEMMETIGSTYGPIVLEELQRRIEKTISDFNEDVTETMKTIFSKHHSAMNQMKECIDKGLIANKPQEELKDPKEDNDDNEEVVPRYISEYEENQKKKKNK